MKQPQQGVEHIADDADHDDRGHHALHRKEFLEIFDAVAEAGVGADQFAGDHRYPADAEGKARAREHGRQRGGQHDMGHHQPTRGAEHFRGTDQGGVNPPDAVERVDEDRKQRCVEDQEHRDALADAEQEYGYGDPGDRADRTQEFRDRVDDDGYKLEPGTEKREQ